MCVSERVCVCVCLRVCVSESVCVHNYLKDNRKVSVCVSESVCVRV